MSGHAAGPLIVTLQFDAAGFARLDALRRAHFPSTRNLIPAHLTLFHALPGDEAPSIEERLRETCARVPPMAVRMTGLRSLGHGVAFDCEAPALAGLRAGLAATWSSWLSPQDSQRWRPHVTIQNKATPEEAHTLLETLSAAFQPWGAQGEGLLLWHYRGGPWEAAGSFPFTG
jgi:2'-5' RNA ligase